MKKPIIFFGKKTSCREPSLFTHFDSPVQYIQHCKSPKKMFGNVQICNKIADKIL